MNRHSLLALLLFAGAVGAQTTTPVPPSGPMIDVPIPITATAADGTTVTTTYTIPGSALWNLFFQATQHEQNAWSLQNMRQYALPVCLVGSGADNAGTFDWSFNKLRVDGEVYSVNAAGLPFRNAIRLGFTTTAQKLCLYGRDIYLKGKTDNKWYQWNGTGWTALTTAQVDPSVLN